MSGWIFPPVAAGVLPGAMKRVFHFLSPEDRRRHVGKTRLPTHGGRCPNPRQEQKSEPRTCCDTAFENQKNIFYLREAFLHHRGFCLPAHQMFKQLWRKQHEFSSR